jgi:hypothetical protein
VLCLSLVLWSYAELGEGFWAAVGWDGEGAWGNCCRCAVLCCAVLCCAGVSHYVKGGGII